MGRLQATAALIWLAISGSTCLLEFCAISVAHGSVVGPAIGGGMQEVSFDYNMEKKSRVQFFVYSS